MNWELIETLWNVNVTLKNKSNQLIVELIETLWNVNVFIVFIIHASDT